MMKAPRLRRDEDHGADDDPIIILRKEHILSPSQVETIITEESR